jgi:hypothetical protein
MIEGFVRLNRSSLVILDVVGGHHDSVTTGQAADKDLRLLVG